MKNQVENKQAGVEVTPEMICAGVYAYLDFSSEDLPYTDPALIVAEILRAAHSTKVETEPDGWERFEKAVGKMVPPRPTKEKKRAGRSGSRKR